MNRADAFTLANKIETETKGKAVVKYDICNPDDFNLTVIVDDVPVFVENPEAWTFWQQRLFGKW